MPEADIPDASASTTISNLIITLDALTFSDLKNGAYKLYLGASDEPLNLTPEQLEGFKVKEVNDANTKKETDTSGPTPIDKYSITAPWNAFGTPRLTYYVTYTRDLLDPTTHMPKDPTLLPTGVTLNLGEACQLVKGEFTKVPVTPPWVDKAEGPKQNIGFLNDEKVLPLVYNSDNTTQPPLRLPSLGSLWLPGRGKLKPLTSSAVSGWFADALSGDDLDTADFSDSKALKFSPGKASTISYSNVTGWGNQLPVATTTPSA